MMDVKICILGVNILFGVGVEPVSVVSETNNLTQASVCVCAHACVCVCACVCM